ncbi:MAG TPA: hypothetical protein VLL05_15190 [Terriglobales bacterium]|nr:hypothetical protein [Terriglobales bacterium]
MTLPLRKNHDTEELTTADLAKPAARIEPTQAAGFQDELEAGAKMPARSDRSIPDISERQTRTPAMAEATPLFPEDQLRDLQKRWNDIQTGFVDEPRTAVQHADALVASTMQQLAEAFSRERTQLEQHWDRGDSISTEDLRVAFQRYRSFFRRMLSL